MTKSTAEVEQQVYKRMLAIADTELSARLATAQESMAAAVLAADAELQQR